MPICFVNCDVKFCGNISDEILLLIILQTLLLTKQTDLSERQIERWWRRRKAQDKPTTLKKFCENVWRCMFYTYSFIFGMIVMWDKSWLWNVKNCWYDYPHQVIRCIICNDNIRLQIFFSFSLFTTTFGGII
jgi:hypothetical protein